MPDIDEGRLRFRFQGDWEASKYDDWAFYTKHFRKICERTRAVDILAFDGSRVRTLWLIEVQDYRHNPRSKMRA